MPAGMNCCWRSNFATGNSAAPAANPRRCRRRLSDRRHVPQQIGRAWNFKKSPLHVYTNALYICAMRRRAITAPEALFQIAEQQQGYFTAKQAAEVGYPLGSQAHHVKSGNWVRVERGIYRLARFPQSDEEQLVIYALWSRN